MPHDVPDTPRFWDELEARLVAAASGPQPLDVPETPEFENRLDEKLVAAATHFTEPRIPLPAVAAIAAIVLITATVLHALPRHRTESVAQPGVARTQVAAAVAKTDAAGPAEAMVVASFQRFVDPRDSVDRLASDLRNRGYEVSVERLTVADPSLDGEVLGIRHAFDVSGSTLKPGSARGPVILIVAQAAANRPVS